MYEKEVEIINLKMRLMFIDTEIEKLKEEKANLFVKLLKEEKKEENIRFKGLLTEKIIYFQSKGFINNGATTKYKPFDVIGI